MTKDRWKELKIQIRQTFGFENEYQEDLAPGTVEVIEFSGPSGKMMVKFVTRPKVLDKKTSYSNRPGSAITVDYVYSEDEFVSHLEIYQWQESSESWDKLNNESLF
ncbi:hypothetical protein KKH39_04775 [Patescibacteria group bacterium]|nr:hypothetical protein [Patescibacteria group bacterium]